MNIIQDKKDEILLFKMNKEISLFKVFMAPTIERDVGKILTSGMITQGIQVEKFENELKMFFNNEHVLTVNSGTSALTLAIKMLKLRECDHILSCPMTCFATTSSILETTDNIIWVDTEPNSCNISLDDIEKKINGNTCAIMIVLFGGTPIEFDKLDTILFNAKKKYNREIEVIIDCAHAFGSEYENKLIGSWNKYIWCFSLQAIKLLTTIDGGLLICRNKEQYNNAKLLRWFGIDREKRSNNNDFRLEDDIKTPGFKYHMNNVNAQVGLSNLAYVNDNLKILRQNANEYNKRLKLLYPKIQLMNENPKHKSSYWLYVIRIIEKNKFIDFMKKKNIMVSAVHQRNDKHSCVYKLKKNLPNLDKLEKEFICIPVGYWLTEEEKENVLSSIENFCALYE